MPQNSKNGKSSIKTSQTIQNWNQKCISIKIVIRFLVQFLFDCHILPNYIIIKSRKAAH